MIRINREVLKVGLSVAAAVLAVGFIVRQVHHFQRSGDAGARVWFYDQSEQQLYSVAADAVPPGSGTGGAPADGVRACVVTFSKRSDTPVTPPMIAYLQTYTPELKELLEKIHEARRSGVPFEGSIPARNSDYFQSNTLVRRVGDSAWYPANTEEALLIMSEWRTWHGPGGESPVVSAPR